MSKQYEHLPRTRAEAMLTEDKLYFTGKPCKYGHVSERKAPGSNCGECLRIRNRNYDRSHLKEYHKTPEWKAYQREYQKKYRKDPKNKERLEKIRRKYLIKKRYNGDEQAYENRRKHKTRNANDS